MKRGFSKPRYLGLLITVALAGCGSNQESRRGGDTEEIIGETGFAAAELLSSKPLVRAPTGPIEGEQIGTMLQFRGIPYAEPPTVDRRWRESVPKKAWTTKLSATKYKAACPQSKASFNKETPPAIEGDEDCLYLNLWAPPAAKKAPVLVWIHGGGFAQGTASGYDPFGAGTTDLYDGLELAKLGNVIVVNFNYRLGMLGFFALPELIAEQGHAGNFGIADMVLALNWVKTNIGAFGGDPNNVTIFGESAGSYATCSLLASPKARGLFHKAAMQSMYCAARSAERAAKFDEVSLARSKLCENAKDRLSCLRSTPLKEIVLAQGEMAEVTPEAGLDAILSGDFLRFVPIIDGKYLPEAPEATIAAAKHAKVPLIIGNTSEEASIALLAAKDSAPKTWEEFSALLKQLPGISDAGVQVLEKTYHSSQYATPERAFVGFLTDAAMTCKVRQTAKLVSSRQSAPVYRFIFDTGVPGLLGALSKNFGAFHGSELFYLFQNLDEVPLGFPSLKEMFLASAMGKYWTSFARSGVPSAFAAPAWNTQSTLLLRPTIATVRDYHGEACDVYEGLAK